MKLTQRQLDNIHIPLWVIKDTCWVLQWKVAGVALVLPALLVSFVLCYTSRNYASRFLPNMAVSFWLLANSTWMLCEFFQWHLIWLAVSFFAIGLTIMCWYYFKVAASFRS